MTRPAGRVGSGQEVVEMSRVGWGRVNKFSSLAGRVKRFSNLTGRVKRFSNLTGRVRSGQEVFKSHGSGRVGPRGVHNVAGRVGS